MRKIAAVGDLPRNDGWFYADALQNRLGPSDSCHREEERRGDLPLYFSHSMGEGGVDH